MNMNETGDDIDKPVKLQSEEVKSEYIDNREDDENDRIQVKLEDSGCLDVEHNVEIEEIGSDFDSRKVSPFYLKSQLEISVRFIVYFCFKSTYLKINI